MNNLDPVLNRSTSDENSVEINTAGTGHGDDGKDGVPGLLKLVLEAHGGYERWKRFNKVSSRVVSGGFLWAMKGMPIDDTPRKMTSDFHRQWSRTEPFGEAHWHMTYTPDRVAIETASGEIMAEQRDPRETFTGHDWETPWTPLQLAYFNGYAMWTYYNLPFILYEPGFSLTQIPSIEQDGLLLMGIRVGFPKWIHTHSPEQNLYFEESGLLRRQDYCVDVAGGSKAGHLISEYVDVQGVKFATKRRVYMRNEDDSLQLDQMPVSIDLSAFELS